jgi:long-subunit acyl-CoA synthetase (AMP-forming)
MKIQESNCQKTSIFQGTTGLPKGVMLTHFNLVANACQSVMGHPDIQICGENEGETDF